MRANISYMLKNWIAWDKKSLVYFLIRVPALVFQPIVTAYIPKAMIDCIEKGVTTRQLILVVALLSLLLTITIWLDPFMKELILGGARIVRMRYAVAAFEKNLSTDYANIENLEMREKQKRAEVFYNGRYAGGSNFISTLNLFFVAVVGVVASGVLIYKINIWMILLIIATCGAQFCLQRALTKKQRQNLDQRTEPAAKFDYFYKLCKDGTAAKDIQLYNMGDYFIRALAASLCRIEKIYARYTHTCVSFNGITALLSAVRQAISDAGGDPKVDFCAPAPSSFVTPEFPESQDVVIVGAGTSGLICATRWAEYADTREEDEMPARELLSRYNDVDVVIIEGYKTEGFDNIVVARSGVDRLRGKSSLDLVDGHTLALACNEALARQAFDAGFATRAININDARAICDLIQDHLA